MTKIFVGGLPFSVNNQGLEDMFKEFGAVMSAQVIQDKFTNRSKGFGFVEMSNDDEAQKAIAALNGSTLENRTLGVSVARPQEDRPRRDDNGGGRNNYYHKGRR